MKINFTKEELLIIQDLCDLGLKQGGLQVLSSISKVLSKINETGLSDLINTNEKSNECDKSRVGSKPSKA